MSAPDRVDVDIPNTSETKMVTVKSTENLRHLMQQQPPQQHYSHDQQQEMQQHMQRQQQQQQHHYANNTSNDQHGHHHAPLSSSPTNSHTSSQSMPMPPPLNSTSTSLLHQPNLMSQPSSQQTSSTDIFTAWTIGSTESLTKNHNQANNAASYSMNGCSILAKFGSIASITTPSRQASPDPTENSSLLSMATMSSSVTPPPPPVIAPTLMGQSQNVMEGNTNTNMSLERQQQQHQQLLQQQQGNNGLMNGSLPAQNNGGGGGGGGGLISNPGIRSQSLPPLNPNSPSPPPPPHPTPLPHNNTNSNKTLLQTTYHTRLLSTPTPAVESLLSSACETLNFDIAEMWLRTGPKTHQLTNSHVRPTALDESVRKQLVDVYYGERSAERRHRLSPALCKRAKEAGDVVWVTAHTLHGAEALKCSISDVRTAVAVPVCHGGSGVNVTIIYFSIRR